MSAIHVESFWAGRISCQRSNNYLAGVVKIYHRAQSAWTEKWGTCIHLLEAFDTSGDERLLDLGIPFKTSTTFSQIL